MTGRGDVAENARTGRGGPAAGRGGGPAALSARAIDTAAAAATETGIGIEIKRRTDLPETKVRPIIDVLTVQCPTFCCN